MSDGWLIFLTSMQDIFLIGEWNMAYPPSDLVDLRQVDHME